MSGHNEEPLKRSPSPGRVSLFRSEATGARVEEMRIGAALSTDPDPAKATAAAVEEARSRLGGTTRESPVAPRGWLSQGVSPGW